MAARTMWRRELPFSAMRLSPLDFPLPTQSAIGASTVDRQRRFTAPTNDGIAAAVRYALAATGRHARGEQSGTPMRFVATLSAGQKILVSVPQGADQDPM